MNTKIASMKRALPFGIVALALLTIIIVVAKVQTSKPQRLPESNQLKWRAEEAKKHNQKKVDVPALQYMYVEPSLEGVLKNFTVLIVEPVKKETFTVSYGNNLVTWNKLRILDTVSTPEEAVDVTSQTPPPEMLPLNRGELLVMTTGGSKVIDGIEVNESGPTLNQGQKYLIYVLLDSSGVGMLAHGPSAISSISGDGNLVPFRKGFDQGETIEALKNNLKKASLRRKQ